MITFGPAATGFRLGGMEHGPIESIRDLRIIRDSIGGTFITHVHTNTPILKSYKIKSRTNTLAVVTALRALGVGSPVNVCMGMLAKKVTLVSPFTPAVQKVMYHGSVLIISEPVIEITSNARTDAYDVELELLAVSVVASYIPLTQGEQSLLSSGRWGSISLEYYYDQF